MDKYYYLIGASVLGVIWMFIYLLRKDLRKEIWVTSLFASVFGITEHFWYYNIYWKPVWLIKIPFVNAGLEDFLLCFFYGGIAAALYEFVLRKHLVKNNKYNEFQRKVISVLSMAAGLGVVLFSEIYLKIGIIYSTGLGIIMIGLVLLFFRKDLIKPAIINFFLMLVVVFIWQGTMRLLFPNMYTDYWIIEKTSKIYVMGVLIEEYFWHASMAFGIGPLFEVFLGYSDRRFK
jgi:hypothetical protein